MFQSKKYAVCVDNNHEEMFLTKGKEYLIREASAPQNCGRQIIQKITICDDNGRLHSFSDKRFRNRIDGLGSINNRSEKEAGTYVSNN